jgi:predicted Zn-dependent protease
MRRSSRCDWWRRFSRRVPATQASLDRLGAIHENAGNLALARENYEAVAQAHGPTAAALLDLARVAYKQKDIDGALGYAAHARDVEPGNAAVHFFFGMLAVEKNLPIEARKSLEAAVRLAPAQPYYNYALGSVALQGRDPAEAIPYFQKFRALRPDDPRGRFALGVAYFTAGDLEQSRRELEAITEAPATKSGAQYFLGRIEKLNENMASAAAHLEKSIQANDAYSDAHAELGLIRFRTSDLAGAAREIDRALELDPENVSANRTRLILYRRTRDPRAEVQAVRVKEVEARRERDWNSLFRTIEVRPY